MATARSVVSLFGAVLLGIGAFCTLMIVFSNNDIIEKLEYTEYYKVIAGISNAIAIGFIIYLTVTSQSRGQLTKWIIIAILVLGYLLELYFAFIFTDKSNETAAFSIVAANLLFRGFYIMQYMQEPWVVPAFDLGIKAAVSSPSVDISGTPQSDVETYRNTFKSVMKQARAQRDNALLDQSSINKAWSIIDRAVSDNTLTKEKLREAASELKYSTDQSPVTVSSLIFGGRKRR
jgi:hypothetical protein